LDSWLDETTSRFLDMQLWFERERLNSPALDWKAYEELPARLPGVGLREIAKNLVRNSDGGAGLRERMLHPRDRILKRLPRLLRTGDVESAETRLVLGLWERFG